jgi:hypothetical protein
VAESACGSAIGRPTRDRLAGTEDASYSFLVARTTGRSVFSRFDKLRRLDWATGSWCARGRIQSARGGSWSKDGMIIYTPTYSSRNFRVADSGGTPQAVPHSNHRDDDQSLSRSSSDGKHFNLPGSEPLPGGPASPSTARRSTAGSREVARVGSSAIYAERISVLFVRDASLMAQRSTPEGVPHAVRPAPTHEADATGWLDVEHARHASANGVLVYGLGKTAGNNRVAMYDRSAVAFETFRPSGTFCRQRQPRLPAHAFEWQQQPLADIWMSRWPPHAFARDAEPRRRQLAIGSGRNNIVYTGAINLRYRIFRPASMASAREIGF